MNNVLNNGLVGIYENKKVNNYFLEEPFNPSTAYPEYPFCSIENSICINTNNVYDSVRECLKTLELDKENYGTVNWNPFKDIIKPGDKVAIKPNFVIDKHNNGGCIWSIITHPSIIRPIVDYAYIALKGRGKLVIADAPQADSDFDNFLKFSRLKSIQSFYKKYTNFEVDIYDLRQMKYAANKDGFLDDHSRIYQNGDPLGYAIVDLKEKSEFCTLATYNKIYGADYDREETIKHHNKDTNEYCISKTILSADVIISVPKMKVHRKAGVTLNMKNIVGINGNKNFLPHFQIGTPEDGGDEFSTLDKKQKMIFYTNRKLIDRLLSRPNPVNVKIYKLAKSSYALLKHTLNIKVDTKKVISAGDWYGNDTTWRMVVDLNKILLYADKEGLVKDFPQRRFISLIDGIIAGEGEGPLIPDSKPCGIIACGFNPYAVDISVTTLMGINYKKLNKFKAVTNLKEYQIYTGKLEDITVKSNNKEYEKLFLDEGNKYLAFLPSAGWISKIEITNP